MTLRYHSKKYQARVSGAERCKYFGVIITPDHRDESEIKKGGIQQPKTDIEGQKMSMDLNINNENICMIFNCEIWVRNFDTRQRNEIKVYVQKPWYYKRIKRNSWNDKITNMNML